MKGFKQLICVVFVFLLCGPAHASLPPDKDLSGVWLVDRQATESLWKSAKTKVDNELLDVLTAMYSLDLDFDTKTLVEGERIGGNGRDAFTVRRKDGHLLLSVNRRGETKVFTLSDHGNRRIRVLAEGSDIPIVLVRKEQGLTDVLEKYGDLSGSWRFTDPAPAVDSLRRAGEEVTDADIREILSIRMVLDMRKGSLSITKHGEPGDGSNSRPVQAMLTPQGFDLQVTEDEKMSWIAPASGQPWQVVIDGLRLPVEKDAGK